MSKRSYRVAASAALIAATAWLAACGAGGEGGAGTAGDSEEMAWLRATKAELDAKRTELAALREQMWAEPSEPEGEAEADAEAAGAEGEAAEGEAEAPIEERIATLENEIATLSEEFGGRLVGYINSLQIELGAPLTPEQQEAIRMKSDEDLEVAKEWIEKGGDYRRAIDIYEMQLQWDPDNESLQQALAEAQEMRYVTQERFDQVQDGMSQSDVRAILGPVNLHNVREYPDRNVVAWFYIKSDEDGGGAAGVYFKLNEKTGQHEVYQRTYEVKTEE